MAEIVILGAGIGGLPMAFEMKENARATDRVTVISNTPTFHFVPSNPWVAVDWRDRDEIELPIAPILEKKGVDFIAVGAKRVHPERNVVELADGREAPLAALHAEHAKAAWMEFVKDPGPVVVGAVQGASCFGPAYEFAMIMETDLRKRKIRDKVPMTYVTSEPYIGHLGLNGVGDSKGLMESIFRDKSIRWICNAKVTKVEQGLMHVTEHDDEGKPKKEHTLPFKYSMMLPAFKGVDAIFGIEGLVNPRGFVLIDEHQRNPKYPNIFAVGVCVAIAPTEPTPVPTGVPKTGYMIESMVTATAHNVRAILDGQAPKEKATWNAVCLADFGDRGAAFVALPQIPPRNVNWFGEGYWVHLAKIAFEKYFIRKMKKGTSEPIYEKIVMQAMGIMKLKDK